MLEMFTLYETVKREEIKKEKTPVKRYSRTI